MSNQEITLDSAKKPEPIWAVVANVILERPFGPGKVETRSGTKKFRGGAKVVCLKFHDVFPGNSVVVIGRHRGSNQYIECHTRYEFLTNWRAELIYSPAIIKRIQNQCKWNDDQVWTCTCCSPLKHEQRREEAWKRHLERWDATCTGGEKAKERAEQIVEYMKREGRFDPAPAEQPFVSTRTNRLSQTKLSSTPSSPNSPDEA